MKNQLAADTVNGVYVCEISGTLENPSSETLIDMDFYDALKSVKDGETIHGLVSDEVAEKISKEYGIK